MAFLRPFDVVDDCSGTALDAAVVAIDGPALADFAVMLVLPIARFMAAQGRVVERDRRVGVAVGTGFQGCSVREIARGLGRTASTISPELRRNAATRSGGLEYRATTTQWHAERSARRPKPAKLALNAALRRLATVLDLRQRTPVASQC